MTDQFERYYERLLARTRARTGTCSPGVEEFIALQAREMVKVDRERGLVSAFEELAQMGAIRSLVKVSEALEADGVPSDDPRQLALRSYLEPWLGLDGRS